METRLKWTVKKSETAKLDGTATGPMSADSMPPDEAEIVRKNYEHEHPYDGIRSLFNRLELAFPSFTAREGARSDEPKQR